MAIKKQSYAGLCEQWVEDVTGEPIQGTTAYDSWQNFYKNKKGVVGLNGAKPGDLVYFASDPNSAYGTDGHVGIYNGNGFFTSATDSGVATANINDWTQHNNQHILGYVPRKNLGEQKGLGGGTMAGADPNALVKIKSPQGQELQVKVSDLPAYGLSADNIPQSAYINGGGAGTTTPSTTSPNTQPGGGIAGSGVSAGQLVGGAIQGTNAGNVQKINEGVASGQDPTHAVQQTQMNTNDLAKQSLQLQEEAFAKDKTLAPKVLGIDLTHKMTLEDAVKKYAASGYMSTQDVVAQYDAYNSTAKGGYGPHKQSQAQLDQMNPTKESIQRKQDVVSGINVMRSLRDAWNEWRANPTDMAALKEYNNLKSILTDPSTNYGRLVASYRASFPDPANPLTWVGADGSFQGTEKFLLDSSGGYTYKMLGLDNPYTKQQGKNGQSSNAINGIAKTFGLTNDKGQVDPKKVIDTTKNLEQDAVGVGGFNNTMAGEVGGAALGKIVAPFLRPLVNPTKGMLYKTMQKTMGGVKEVNYQNAAQTARDFMKDATPQEKAALEKWVNHFKPLDKNNIPENPKGVPKDATQNPNARELKTNPQVRKKVMTEVKTRGGGVRRILKNVKVPGSRYDARIPLREGTPTAQTKTINTPKFTGLKALETRGSMTRKLPSGHIASAFSKLSSEDKTAINALRHGLSQEIKRVAPQMKSLDRLYTFYSKYGSPAKLLGTYAAVEILDKAPIPDRAKTFLEPIVSSPEAFTILRGL